MDKPPPLVNSSTAGVHKRCCKSPRGWLKESVRLAEVGGDEGEGNGKGSRYLELV